MDPTSSIRNANELGCRCREKCSCRTILDCYDQQMKSHRIGVDYWSTNPCQPWVTSLFSSNASAGSHRTNSTVGMLYDNRGSYQRGTLNVAINNNTVSFMSSQTITRNDEFPAETRRSTIQKKSISTSPIFMPRYDIIGHPSLRIYKFKLPTNLLHLLDYIVKSCNSHALSLQRGWATYLYSLTKQDIAVRDVEGLYEVCMHLSFLKVCCISRSGLTDQPYRIHSLRLPDRLWHTSRKQSRVFTVFILLESIGISLTF